MTSSFQKKYFTSVIMTEPIDPTFFVNVEAELARTCTVFEGGAGAGARR